MGSCALAGASGAEGSASARRWLGSAAGEAAPSPARFGVIHGATISEDMRARRLEQMCPQASQTAKSGLHGRGVPAGASSAIQMARTVPATQESDGRLAVAAGESHKFVEDPGLFLKAGP